MSETTQPTPENKDKKPSGWKIAYGITVAVLVAVLAGSGAMYLKDRLPTAAEPTVAAPTVAKPTSPTPTLPTEPTYPPIEQGKTDIRLNEHSEAVSLLGKAARDYLAAENVRDVSVFLESYWAESRKDCGAPVELSYTVYALPEGVAVERSVFRVYPLDGSGDYLELEPEAERRAVFVYNLQTGVKYRYSVTIFLSDGSEMNLPGSFRTAASPRLMYLDGLVNVRDLGGWQTGDGKWVKQGLLYRGSELDGLFEPDFKLSQQGLEQMKALGIKTDLDLRHTGNDVLEGEHFLYNAIQYEHAFTPEGMEAVRRLFADLADPANYPAYLHCTYGADRTGTMCYLLLGLLGVEDADLKRDYELTALYYGYVSPAQMDAFVAKIAALPGNSTQERIEQFLLDAGVTRDQIQSIRQIFLG